MKSNSSFTKNQLALMGWPLQQSLSPAIHNLALKYNHLDNWKYSLLSCKPEQFSKKIQELLKGNFRGLNLTIPFKEKGIELFELAPKSPNIGAINTIDFVKKQCINTDVGGFQKDILHLILPKKGLKVVILGAGGASRSAVYTLSQKKVKIFMINRNQERAEKVLEDLKVFGRVGTFEEALSWKFDLLVNCTPLGMLPNFDESPWPQEIPFPSNIYLYDMIYLPIQTKLMKQVLLQGGKVRGGLGMLVEQAMESFEFWTGNEAPREAIWTMIQQKRSLNKNS